MGFGEDWSGKLGIGTSLRMPVKVEIRVQKARQQKFALFSDTFSADVGGLEMQCCTYGCNKRKKHLSYRAIAKIPLTKKRQ